MPLIVEEVEDEKDFDEIFTLLYAAFGEPYNSWRRFFVPTVCDTLEAAIEYTKVRNIEWWKHTTGTHWVKVVDTDPGKIVGTAKLIIRQTGWPPRNPPKRMAYWHIEGSEEKAFTERLMMEMLRFLAEEVTGPHIELGQLCVHPDHRRRGVGRLLVSWGIRRSELLRLEFYSMSVPFAVPIFQKYGFCKLQCLDPDMATSDPSEKWKEYAADDLRLFLMHRSEGHD
ncbi:hypothetical protein F5Y05DRAFT_25111 [Hypoxylon sp. FL0543]|nr:hypothetical protein F5Y05DRAFT_25111 [Hypoxylon sp. FL0543]